MLSDLSRKSNHRVRQDDFLIVDRCSAIVVVIVTPDVTVVQWYESNDRQHTDSNRVVFHPVRSIDRYGSRAHVRSYLGWHSSLMLSVQELKQVPRKSHHPSVTNAHHSAVRWQRRRALSFLNSAVRSLR